MLRHQRENYGKKAGSEHQSLLARFSPPKPSMYVGVASICHLPKEFCMKSKASILVVSWTALVGGLVIPMMGKVHFALLYTFLMLHLDVSWTYVVLYFFVALLYMFYPLIGFLADVYCGRLRVIMISLCSVLCFSLIFCVNYTLLVYVTLPDGWAYFTIIVSLLCVIGIIVGAAGYRSNLVQFGLDQLLDAPSHHQGLFAHWALWSYELLTVIFVAYFAKYICYLKGNYVFYFVSTLFCSFALALLTIFGCWKHHWFYSQAVSINPFKVVIKVLDFARKHRYPPLRSAFTYCDDERPTRLDYGKVRYGGPFTTEQVEDVKTFLRIVGVLLTIGPAFVMDVPTSNVSLLYIGKHVTFDIPGILCDQWKWVLINSGLLRCVFRVVFIPLYVWITFVHLKRSVPRILCRLGLGIVIYITGIVSILLVDIIGHAHHQGNDTTCIFTLQTFHDSNHTYKSVLLPDDTNVTLFTVPYLDMHWSVLIPTQVFLAIGPSLAEATTYEFISAQSPQYMKGLLLGSFFAICGVFEFIGSVALVPFTSKQIRSDGNPIVISCLTSYLIVISIIALIGLALFSVVAKKYKYRERDDRPYDHRFVIDVYNRYLNQV